MPASELNKLKEMEKRANAHAGETSGVEEEDESAEVEHKAPVKKFDPDSTGYFDFLGGTVKSPRGMRFDPQSEDIEQLLTLLNLGQCIELFCQEEITVSELLSLSDEDMKDLNLKFQHRRKLKCAIQKISQARKGGREQMVYL